MHDPERYDVGLKILDGLNFEYVPKLVNAMSWNFKKGNVLDYGCGPGRTGFKFILPQVESTDSNMYSVDISTEMIDFASANFSNPRIQYGLAALPKTFPFPNVLFDKMIAINVFHFVKDLKPLLKSVMNILKPSGQLGFTCITTNNIRLQVEECLAESPQWKPYMSDYKRYLPDWTNYENSEPKQFFRNIIRESGFNEVYLEFKTTVVTADIDEFLECTLSVNPCIKNFPEEMLGQLKQDYHRLFSSMSPDLMSDDSYNYEFEYLCAVIQKPLQ